MKTCEKVVINNKKKLLLKTKKLVCSQVTYVVTRGLVKTSHVSHCANYFEEPSSFVRTFVFRIPPKAIESLLKNL